MSLSADVIVGVVMAVVGALTTWLFSLHGRMSRHEAACEQRQNNLNERHVLIQDELRDIKSEAKSTNRKLDRLLVVARAYTDRPDDPLT